MGNPAWSADERFKDAVTRKQHWDTVKNHLSEWTVTRTQYEVVAAAQNAGIPVLPVNTTADLVNSKQLRQRGFFKEIEHPLAGMLRYPGPPFKQSIKSQTTPTAAPLLGEHNHIIFRDQLGISWEELAAMIERGTI